MKMKYKVFVTSLMSFLLLSVVTISSFACIPVETFIDLWNAKSQIEIEGSLPIVLRSQSPLDKILTGGKVKVVQMRRDNFTGLYQYDLAIDGQLPVDGKMKVVFDGNTILISLKITKDLNKSFDQLDSIAGCGDSATVRYK